ncbi:MAG: hypothetical protein JWM74_4679, partial [Myxococcaceae bacterium]|nr:hypothetical protein [Myxococcaceae bacterium]
MTGDKKRRPRKPLPTEATSFGSREGGGEGADLDALTAPLRPLAETWRGVVRTPRRRALAASVAFVIVIALLVARVGTTKARVAAGLAMVSTLALVLVVRRREQKLWSDPASVIDRVAGHIDPERARRALRALTLIDNDGEPRSPGTSGGLARLHVERSIAALPLDKVAFGASRHAARIGMVAIVFALGTLGVFISNPWGTIEGADVLFATKGLGPLTMKWLVDLEVRARPPEYLHEEEHHEAPFTDLALPRGTLITFRGAATHNGRRLLLTDGASEVPFVDDGAGKMVARWPLAETVVLRVVARFGDVVIEEPQTTAITSIDDKAPIVKLEGAPRTLSLASGEVSSEIPIRYEVTDDHGLREVHLVLRSGAREERRVLARLDGETRLDRGGHILRATDPFLKKSHAPVEVRVEAKDNDPITGPKWGASEAITVLPPDVGEPEAKRLDGLRKLRDALVDALAWRLENAPPTAAADRRAFIATLLRGAEENADLAEATLSTSYAGVRVAPRLQAILRGQLRKLKTAVDAEARALGAPSHAATVKATERIVLVVDAMVRGLAVRDAKETAKQLADVADDLVVGLGQMRSSSDTDRGTTRSDAAVTVLGGGSKSLLQLGMLGKDLGEIVTADLSRVGRARKATDLVHAELAARDLAARLHQPDPSFGAQGKSGRAGGESGGGRGTPGDASGDDPSEADKAFNEAAQDLEQLAQEHAGEIGKNEQALSGAASDEDLKSLVEEAKKHAAAVREATEPLPTVGGGSDSWTSKGAAAREHGEQMARSLEQGNPADAVASGRNAMQALDEAKRTAQREHWSSFGNGGTEAEKKIDDAKKKLEPEVKWAEEKLEGLRKKAAERAASELSKGGEDEGKLADRAGKLGDKGREQGGLPSAALESL